MKLKGLIRQSHRRCLVLFLALVDGMHDTVSRNRMADRELEGGDWPR